MELSSAPLSATVRPLYRDNFHVDAPLQPDDAEMVFQGGSQLDRDRRILADWTSPQRGGT